MEFNQSFFLLKQHKDNSISTLADYPFCGLHCVKKIMVVCSQIACILSEYKLWCNPGLAILDMLDTLYLTLPLFMLSYGIRMLLVLNHYHFLCMHLAAIYCSHVPSVSEAMM